MVGATGVKWPDPRLTMPTTYARQLLDGESGFLGFRQIGGR
ncbi:hypothetical protein PspLS_00704 [Pyricularia sp. CBS 133598]|nr:hypothetical protein PspLS_00704 [Pyricularia sp. CBS 133598]